MGQIQGDGMTESHILDEKEQLAEKAMPGIHLDTSVIIDYWSVDGLEFDRDESIRELQELQYYQTIRELLRSEKHTDSLVEIRKRVILGQSKITPVTSALALFELTEWFVEAAIRQMASEAVSDKRTILIM